MRTDRTSLRGSDRAVSVSVGYVLNLAVATLLLSGLFVASGSFVEREHESAIDDELTVIGERLSGDLQTADRMVRTAIGDDPTVRIETDLPRRAAGTHYSIFVEDHSGEDEPHRLVLETRDVTVTVPFRTNASVAETSTSATKIIVEWDAVADELVVSAR